MTIGFIRDGAGSDALLIRLVDAGHIVSVYQNTRSGQESGVAAGTRQAHTLADLCQGSDVIISLLENDAALLLTVHGPSGLLANLAPRTVHVALGMHSAKAIAEIGAAHSQHAQPFVAAPILTATATETAGTVAAAGPQATLDALAPVFQALEMNVFHAGETPQTAATLALVHAGLLWSAVEAMAEAFSLVRKYDVDPHIMHDVITDGLFRGSEAHRSYGIEMLDGVSVTGNDVSAARALATLDLVLAAADETKVPMPSIDACRDRLLGAIAHGEADASWTALAREQSRASGLD